jgi:hypothetical protein
MDSPFLFRLRKHFIGAFMVFCPIHQRVERCRRGKREKKGKRTPSTCLACNNFFDDGSIKWKMFSRIQWIPRREGRGRERSGRVREMMKSGCSGRFISRHVLVGCRADGIQARVSFMWGWLEFVAKNVKARVSDRFDCMRFYF